jgi:hypothetical protein
VGNEAQDAGRRTWDRTKDAGRDAADSARDVGNEARDRANDTADRARNYGNDVAHDAVQTADDKTAQLNEATRSRRIKLPMGGLAFSREDATNILALHVCASIADHTEQGEGFFEQCKAEQYQSFADYLDVPECADSVGWDEQAVKECAKLAYNPEFGFAPLTAEQFLTECSPAAMCH